MPSLNSLEVKRLIKQNGDILFADRADQSPTFEINGLSIALRRHINDFSMMGQSWLLKLQSQITLTASTPPPDAKPFKPSRVSITLTPQELAQQKIEVHRFGTNASLSLLIATQPDFENKGFGSGLMELYNQHIKSVLSEQEHIFSGCSFIFEKIIDNSGSHDGVRYLPGPSSHWARQLGFTQDDINPFLWTREVNSSDEV